MDFVDMESDAETPLLFGFASSPQQAQSPDYHSILKPHDPEVVAKTTTTTTTIQPARRQRRQPDSHRSLEDDVLPEIAVSGRNLGWSSAFILIISRVVGSGIFATPGSIVSSVGSVGLTLALWVVGALISWCGLAVALEYGCMLPRSGGEKVYLEFTYPRPRFLASTLVAVHAVVMGFTASNCIVFGEYVLFVLGYNPGEHPGHVRLLAVGLMTVITVLHGCFLRAGIVMQNVLGWVKIVLIVLLALASGFVVLSRYSHEGIDSTLTTSGTDGTGNSRFPATWDGMWEGSVWDLGVITTALFKVFYSYAGLQNLHNVLNEVKDPVRTLRSAATAALVTACVLYLLINVAYFLVVPLEDIKLGGELVGALFFEQLFGQTLGRRLLSLAVALSAAGNVMVVTFSLARLNQEIARQGLLPLGAAISSSRPFGAPLGGLILHYIPSVLVICIPYKDIYSFILNVEGYPAQLFSLAISLGLLKLRWSRPELKRPYRAFLPAVWFMVFLSCTLLCAPFVARRGEHWAAHLSRVSYVLVGLSVIVFGILYWAVLTVFLPWLRGYRLEEVTDVIPDGTTITKLVHTPVDWQD
ncbi:amino acid transporter [Parathielavia appendiculata]|uniref:Amino acid transporter n=1 Tax=Parathielavia appendiculata TaxID=2587402 RepID=A0AAN6U5X6_9PEZI|nr:amino acid transporter [Parathielavia appendiculata]